LQTSDGSQAVSKIETLAHAQITCQQKTSANYYWLAHSN